MRTPCLRKLIPALLASSHSKPTAQVYVPFVHTSILAVRGDVGACGAIAGTRVSCSSNAEESIPSTTFAPEFVAASITFPASDGSGTRTSMVLFAMYRLL